MKGGNKDLARQAEEVLVLKSNKLKKGGGNGQGSKKVGK